MVKQSTIVTQHNSIQSYLNKCIGLRVSDAWRGIQKAIFLELGKLHKHQDKRTHASRGKGDVTLMLDCRWRLEGNRTIIVGSLNRYKKIENQITKLIGKKIKKISFTGRIPEIVVEFNGDRWLQSFTSYYAEDWHILFRNNGTISRKYRRVVYEKKRR